MSDSLYIAATGMHVQQKSLETIANNLANVNTTGFKKNRIQFEDLMYKQIARASGDLDSAVAVDGVGVGAAIAGSEKVFTAGELKKTERALDMAIRGNGFFEVSRADGTLAYTRTGSFSVDNDGVLVTAAGDRIIPLIEVPVNSESLVVQPDGTVLTKLPGQDDLVELGRMELANFSNPGGLNAIGGNLYLPTNRSGDAVYTSPGDEGAGLIAQGFLEASNVQLVEELTNMLLTQRAFEINSKVIQVSDEMMGIVNNLRR